MKLSRPSRLIAVLVALFSILFMQFAVADYACLELIAGQNNQVEISASANVPDMPGCSGMDELQPNLCHAYDHAGTQSLDKPVPPGVQPFSATGLVLAINFFDAVNRPIFNRPDSLLLRRAAAPPLSITHCCFRI